jgi:hypothetical protein
MNLEEYLAKIIKLAKKNESTLEITINDNIDNVITIDVYDGGWDSVDWHLCKSLDEQPNKEELKSLFKGFKI